MTAEFTIPLRTGRGLNDRQHWAQRSARVATERKAVALCFPRLWRGAFKAPRAAQAVVHLTRGSPGELDSDNLQGALKACRDEVAKQLALPDDRDKRVAWTYGQERTTAGEYWVSVRLEWVKP